MSFVISCSLSRAAVVPAAGRLARCYLLKQRAFLPYLGTNAPLVKHARNRPSQSRLQIFLGSTSVIGQALSHLAFSA